MKQPFGYKSVLPLCLTSAAGSSVTSKAWSFKGNKKHDLILFPARFNKGDFTLPNVEKMPFIRTKRTLRVYTLSNLV